MPEVAEDVINGVMDETAAKNAEMNAQEIIALVSTEEQCQIAMAEERLTTVYVDVAGGGYKKALELCEKVKQVGKKAFLVLPHIFRRKEKEKYRTMVEQLRPELLDGFLVKSLEELAFLKETGLDRQYEVRLNYNLYVFQQSAKQFFKKKGYQRFTVPVELNEEEITGLGVADCDFIIYGRLPLMVSAQCVRENVFTCSGGKKTEGIILKDRMGAEFPVRQNCDVCYNIIYNSACFSLLGTDVEQRFAPAGWRLDFTLESKAEMQEVLDAFFDGRSVSGKESFTKGHFKRGIE